jgi:nucleotide-binding universal stress UspA family protein
MYDDILVPTDGSASAERAARYAVVLADAYDARIHALCVVDERDYDGDVVGADVVDSGRTAAQRGAGRAVATVADLAEGSVETHVTTGVPSDAVLAYVADAGVDLVVMGTHGRTGVERFVIGSVAERVVRHADTPVVTVRATDAAPVWPPLDRILVPTDGSEAAAAALPYAFDLAERFDATIESLSVVDERATASVYTVESALEAVAGGLEATADAATRDAVERADERGIPATAAVVEGLPSRAICAHAESSGADVVVLSSHGRTGLAHYLLGSVAERVVRNCTVPVFTVRADETGAVGGA